MHRTEKILRFLLRAMAAAESLAVCAVFMRRSWIEACHAWLGLGAFPAHPIAEYLARHLSAMYAIHAGFLWVAASDIKRHLTLVRYVAVSGLFFSALITVLDLRTGFPWFWTIGEGPLLTLLSLLMLVFLSKLRDEQRSEEFRTVSQPRCNT